MFQKEKLTNLIGYLILLSSFIGLMIVKNLEVRAIKKYIHTDNYQNMNVK